MNAVIEKLLQVSSADAWPSADASSYWRLHGSQVVAEKRDGKLVLQASGCGAIQKERPHDRFLRVLERLYYRRYTSQFKSYAGVWKETLRLANDLSSTPNLNAFKAANVLAILADHWMAKQYTPRTIAIIGDGNGFFGALIRRYIPGVRLYFIDLPKMLIFQSYIAEQADPGARMALYPLTQGTGNADIFFVTPSDVEAIPDTIDCAINVCSMQEMPESSIAAYFAFLRRRSVPASHFFCLNRERKELPGGEVTSFKNYPWSPEDRIFLDEVCPFLSMCLSVQPLEDTPRLFGVRVPLINSVSPHLQRLVHLAPSS